MPGEKAAEVLLASPRMTLTLVCLFSAIMFVMLSRKSIALFLSREKSTSHRESAFYVPPTKGYTNRNRFHLD